MIRHITILSICFLILFSPLSFAKRKVMNDPCKMGEAPEVIHPMENYDIAAGNSATIKTSSSFSGIDLTFDVQARNKYQNVVKINSKTGTVHIRGDARDNFDVLVTAMNYCGSATMKFTVTVSEK